MKAKKEALELRYETELFCGELSKFIRFLYNLLSMRANRFAL